MKRKDEKEIKARFYTAKDACLFALVLGQFFCQLEIPVHSDTALLHWLDLSFKSRELKVANLLETLFQLLPVLCIHQPYGSRIILYVRLQCECTLISAYEKKRERK